jgi:hypothetical protein
MDDEKLKVILALLSGIIFSLIFILLAFILPLNPPKVPQKQWIRNFENSPKNIKKINSSYLRTNNRNLK